MKLKQILLTTLISALVALATIFGYEKFNSKEIYFSGQFTKDTPSNYRFTGMPNGSLSGNDIDFRAPAAASIPAVVHIKTKTNAKQANNVPRVQRQNPFSDMFGDDFFDQFFGGRSYIIPEQKASGSGVIISENGYIVTNNHVVQNADEITVTLNNKKTYKATLVGADQAYDLAVIKINANRLPFLLYGNSDNVEIGQWVLAIGYPLNLETTVTAGIVSAKSRSLGLNRDNSGGRGIESFIQTDAAVNMGNSGGALINTDGKLIGINSAIASPTGYYSGYSYAIPVNIVSKVVDDIIQFGTVQRAYLGINYVDTGDLTEEEKKAEGIPTDASGIYVAELPTDGAAFAAGIRKGDYIRKINGVGIGNGAEMLEQVSRYKPGDKISVVYSRKGKEVTVPVTLKNKAGTYEVVKVDNVLDVLGAEFETLDSKKASSLGIDGGVWVKRIGTGAIEDQTRMKDNFIILKANDMDVKSVDELRKVVSSGKILNLSGFYPGSDGLYEYRLSL
ncbi:MAG: trypsin-like peptidase domain-containing protein [Ferruginibacter sp.]|nr:trypsin-like peptidase domain-containing protein [Ferruginibacter sp.]